MIPEAKVNVPVHVKTSLNVQLQHIFVQVNGTNFESCIAKASNFTTSVKIK
jgi:hypothetical protein